MNRLIPLLAALFSACAPTGQPLARPAYGDSGLAATDGGYRVSLVNEWGGGLPTYGRGSETWIEGVLGQRYQVRVDNPTGRRVEAVVTVDGRDVITGAPGGLEARGYVIEPWGHVIIDGFRTSNSGVATFRFTTPGDSYAGRVGGGANIGVIGVAVFEENAPVAMVPHHHHHDHPGRGWWGDDEAEKSAAPAPAEARGEAAYDSAPAPRSAPGLGTQYGEHRYSPVSEVAFQRASSAPVSVLAVYYDNREGLARRGIVPPAYHPGQPEPFPAWSDRRYAPPPP